MYLHQHGHRIYVHEGFDVGGTRDGLALGELVGSAEGTSVVVDQSDGCWDGRSEGGKVGELVG